MSSSLILFYRFYAIDEVESVWAWQQQLAAQCKLTGRVIISAQGINATLAGSDDNIDEYLRETRAHQAFSDIDVKREVIEVDVFPRLSVKLRDQLVSFDLPDHMQIDIDETGVKNTGVHLTPQAVHDLVEEHGDQVVFLDGRNEYEANIGRFEGAYVPPGVRHTRDFAQQLQKGAFDHLRDKKIVSYCTGGVRCEVLSAILKQQGFEDVYQLDGGIISYGKHFGDDGLWKGSLRVFDGRETQHFASDTIPLGRCTRCASPTDKYYNCSHDNQGCFAMTLYCHDCYEDRTCSSCHNPTR